MEAVPNLLIGRTMGSEGTELVSAVYSISFSKKVNQPVKVKMQHCVALKSETQTKRLRFVLTTKGQHETFEFVEGGQFYPGNKYGTIEQLHFCETGIVAESDSEDDGSGKILTKDYVGNLLYETIQLNHWIVEFFVYKEIDVYEQYVQKRCKEAKIDQRILFGFSDKYIELDISEPVSIGWSLYPHAKPLRLDKADVDKFGSSVHTPPSCMITIYGKETPDGTEPLHHPIKLRGVECNVQTLYIICLLQRESNTRDRSPNSLSDTPPSTDTDLINQLVSKVKGVFTKNAFNLSEFLQPSMDEFASIMLEDQLINHSVSRSSSCMPIIDQFVSSITFMQNRECLEARCTKFLQVLNKMGEPYVIAIEQIKRQLVEETGITLTI